MNTCGQIAIADNLQDCTKEASTELKDIVFNSTKACNWNQNIFSQKESQR